MSLLSYLGQVMKVLGQRIQTVCTSVPMFSKVQDQFQWRADLLVAGRHGDLASEFIFPCAFYIGQELRMFRDAAEFAKGMCNFRQHLLARGTCKYLADLISLEVPRNGRFRAWVNFRELASDGAVLKTMATLQYCQQTDHGIRTAMVECWMCSIEDFAEMPLLRSG